MKGSRFVISFTIAQLPRLHEEVCFLLVALLCLPARRAPLLSYSIHPLVILLDLHMSTHLLECFADFTFDIRLTNFAVV